MEFLAGPLPHSQLYATRARDVRYWRRDAGCIVVQLPCRAGSSGRGDIMLINPGQMHTGRAVGSHGSTYRMFYPSTEILMEVAGEIAGKPQRLPAFPVSRVHDPALADLVLSLHRGSENASISPLECDSRLLDVLARLIELHADESDSMREGRPWHSSVRHAVEYLQAHYAENVSLQQLASVENLSQFYLLRTFRNTVGVPPHVYQMQLRVSHARELLLRGFSPVQVAAETGFADQESSHQILSAGHRCDTRSISTDP